MIGRAVLGRFGRRDGDHVESLTMVLVILVGAMMRIRDGPVASRPFASVRILFPTS